MTRHQIPLISLLTLVLSASLGGCDSTIKHTEQEHIQRAKDFEDKGNLKGSIIELKNAIQKNPDSPQARLLLGQIYLKAGLGTEAEKELSQASQLGVGAATIKPLLGEALMLMGEYRRVLDEIHPDSQTSRVHLSRILQLRADALLKLGKVGDACNLYLQSLEADRQNPPTYWGLAQCEIAKRDMNKAREWLETALTMRDRQARSWLYMGDYEQINKRPDAALVAYSTALKTEPNNLDALQSRAIVRIKLGQLDAASEDIATIARLAPKSVRANYLKASLNYTRRQFDEANGALQEVFKLTSDHAPSLLLAGMTAHAQGAYQQAETHFKRFLGRVPGHTEAMKMLATTQLRTKQANEALKTLAPLLASRMNDAQALALAGEAYLVKGDAVKAADYFERALAIDPDNAAIRTRLGFSHLASGNTKNAIHELAEVATRPNQHGAEMLLILTHLNQREYDQALALIAQLDTKLARSPAMLNMAGRAYLGKNDRANARQRFEQALAAEPLYYPAVSSLAQLDLQDNQPEAARKRFEAILSRDKNNLFAMMALAEMAALARQEREQVNWLEKASRAHPKAIGPRIALARVHLAQREFQQALALANEAVRTDPDHPLALNLLGTVQLAMNDKAGATSTFTRLTQKADQSPDALLRLARTQIADRKPAAARTTLEKALKLKPDHLESLDTLATLTLQEGKHEAALSAARQIQARHPQSAIGFLREGDILLAQKRPAVAVKSYEQALTRGAGSNGFIQQNRAQRMAGNAKLAEQQLADWLKQYPSDTTVRAYAAQYHIVGGRNQEAIAEYQIILRQRPDDPAVLNNLATLYVRERDRRGLPTAERAYKLAPDSPAIQDTLGWAHIEQGQPSRGLSLLQQALKSAPRNPVVRYHHAVALARTGNETQARKALQLLLADTPAFDEREAAKRLLDSLSKSSGATQ